MAKEQYMPQPASMKKAVRAILRKAGEVEDVDAVETLWEMHDKTKDHLERRTMRAALMNLMVNDPPKPKAKPAPAPVMEAEPEPEPEIIEEPVIEEPEEAPAPKKAGKKAQMMSMDLSDVTMMLQFGGGDDDEGSDEEDDDGEDDIAFDDETSTEDGDIAFDGDDSTSEDAAFLSDDDTPKPDAAFAEDDAAAMFAQLGGDEEPDTPSPVITDGDAPSDEEVVAEVAAELERDLAAFDADDGNDEKPEFEATGIQAKETFEPGAVVFPDDDDADAEPDESDADISDDTLVDDEPPAATEDEPEEPAAAPQSETAKRTDSKVLQSKTKKNQGPDLSALGDSSLFDSLGGGFGDMDEME